MIKLKDILLVFGVFATPFIQLSLTIAGELSLSTSIGKYNIFYTDFFALIIIFLQIFVYKKLEYNKIAYLILLGLFISFISCFVNGYDNWFLRFLIGADFYFYGLLLSVVNFKWEQIRIIRAILLMLFYFVCTQMILISTGLVNMDKGVDMEGLIRFGSTAGSSIQSAFLIFILMAILTFLFKKRSILLFSINAIGTLAIMFSLSRGSILSLVFVFVVYGIIHFKKSKKEIILFMIIMVCSLFVLEKQFRFVSIMEERNVMENITSGRNERWKKTFDVYKQSFLLFGAGNAITPSERSFKSVFESERNLTNSPHNVYLSFLVENGILGIVNFIVLLLVLFRNLLKKKVKLSYHFLFFLSLPLIMMNTEIILRNGIVAFFFWFLFFLLRSTTTKTTRV